MVSMFNHAGNRGHGGHQGRYERSNREFIPSKIQSWALDMVENISEKDAQRLRTRMEQEHRMRQEQERIKRADRARTMSTLYNLASMQMEAKLIGQEVSRSQQQEHSASSVVSNHEGKSLDMGL